MLTPREKRNKAALKRVSWGDETATLRKSSNAYGGWGLFDTKIIPNIDELRALNNNEPLGFLYPVAVAPSSGEPVSSPGLMAQIAQEKRRWLKQRKSAQIEALRTKSQSQVWRIPREVEQPSEIAAIHDRAKSNASIFDTAKDIIEIPNNKVAVVETDPTMLSMGEDPYDPAISFEDEEDAQSGGNNNKTKRSRWGEADEKKKATIMAKKSRWESNSGSAPSIKTASSRWGEASQEHGAKMDREESSLNKTDQQQQRPPQDNNYGVQQVELGWNPPPPSAQQQQQQQQHQQQHWAPSSSMQQPNTRSSEQPGWRQPSPEPYPGSGLWASPPIHHHPFEGETDRWGNNNMGSTGPRMMQPPPPPFADPVAHFQHQQQHGRMHPHEQSLNMYHPPPPMPQQHHMPPPFLPMPHHPHMLGGNNHMGMPLPPPPGPMLHQQYPPQPPIHRHF